MKKLFLRVDLQEDFIRKTGSLYVPNVEQILGTTEKLTKFIEFQMSKDSNIFCAYTQDWHLKNDVEFKVYPSHCIRDTDGANIIKEAMISQNFKNSKIFKKRTYDIFQSKINKPSFKTFINDFDEIWVDGVVTEICVHSAVMGIKKYFPNIKVCVFENAIMHISEEEKNKVFKIWKENKIFKVNVNL
jgi:nicotinamidase/pyrazinamidase